MRSSQLLAQQFSRIAPCTRPRLTRSTINESERLFSYKAYSSRTLPAISSSQPPPHIQAVQNAFFRRTTSRPTLTLNRCFSQSPTHLDSSTPATKTKATQTSDDDDAELGLEQEQERGFGKSEKASQAAQVDLSARLSKEGKSLNQSAGFWEIWRLVKIARPEAKALSVAFVFLLFSSGISVSVPFSIGKILDVATKPEAGTDHLFGLDITTFYTAIGGILVIGAGANYGRITILRIVGERIVARLRSQLFRRTFIQNAEFFDANRVGDLISRLSSDTIIVGKSITQNLSDGLRSLVSGAAGVGLMAFVSMKLTGILTFMLPLIGVGAFFYGKAIRNLSRKIQRNLGTLTKIAEERLGNVRTSQAFAGEILEVSRYNKQVKKIFNLGRREAFISATFFSTVS
ncbi:MAG: hypothetical protein Q9188_006671 [Gyalolechia gomerana]